MWMKHPFCFEEWKGEKICAPYPLTCVQSRFNFYVYDCTHNLWKQCFIETACGKVREEISSSCAEGLLGTEKVARPHPGSPSGRKYQAEKELQQGMCHGAEGRKRTCLIHSRMVDLTTVSYLDFVTSFSQRWVSKCFSLSTGNKRKHRSHLLCCTSVSCCHFLTNGTKFIQRIKLARALFC